MGYLDLSNIDPKDYYINILKGKKMITDKTESTFRSLEEWYRYPYKYDIMVQANEFKHYLRKISGPKWYRTTRDDLGMYPGDIHTPILTCKNMVQLEGYIEYFKKSIDVPQTLIDTKLAKQILNEMESTCYTDNVFCHMCLDYKSFVVENNKLVGIVNWEYAGYYPPELEDIIQRYLEYLNIN